MSNRDIDLAKRREAWLDDPRREALMDALVGAEDETIRVEGYDSIEEWAAVAGWTLGEGLDEGVSQDDDGAIRVSPRIYEWWNAKAPASEG